MQRPRGRLQQTQVDKLESGGMALVAGSGHRIWIPWQQLGLIEAPQNGSADRLVLRWRLHCVEPESGARDFFTNDRNRWVLSADQGRCIQPRQAEMRTGILDVELEVERKAILSVVNAAAGPTSTRRLLLAKPLCVCLEHRQPWDKGAMCLCGSNVVRSLQQRGPVDQFKQSAAYAVRWGAMVEMEAAASAIESNETRFLCDAYVQWDSKNFGGKRRGNFNVAVSLARAHKLKFRGLIAQGGETASAWLCIRDARDADHSDNSQEAPWAGHARVVAAGILGEGAELGLDDEDNLKSVDGRRSITVVFELFDEVSDPGLPPGDFMVVEYIQKALSHSMQHTAIGEVNPAPPADGTAPKSLLARDVVLNRLPPSVKIDQADLIQWKLNSSQDKAVRRALVSPLMLVHGPPGTGKTRTAAVLMTLLAQRNLGARCAMLFAAPTNRACDAALHSTNRLCEGHFAERLRARVEDDGEADCAICLEGAPDIVTACGHVFHRACVAKSLQQSSKCPMCRQVLKQHGGGLRILRVYGADSEREDFPVPRRIDHKGIQTFKTQTVPVEMRRFTLHWRCHAAVEGEEPSAEALRCRQAYERLRATTVRSKDFEECRAEYYDALTKARAVEVHQSDIIFTTCVSARRMALISALEADGAPEIRQVVLDEAGQAPEPEALCPLAVARHARQAVFFGDHKQLRPILRSKLAEQAGLGVSLFERLATQDWGGRGDAPVTLLAQQYRMHPSISRFPCQHFYDGRVSDDLSVTTRSLGALAHPRTMDKIACLLWDCNDSNGGENEQLQRVRTVGAGGVGSRCNIEEARRAVTLATKLAREAGQSSVAVLSWYNSQVAKVSEMLRRSNMGGVHVGSIATAQGSEWDYVILSAVRSGAAGGSLGLLSDPHNLNVALTRAKLGLVVLCDVNTLQRDIHWNALINSYRAEGLVLREPPAVIAVPNRVASPHAVPEIRRTAVPPSVLPPAPPAPPAPPMPNVGTHTFMTPYQQEVHNNAMHLDTASLQMQIAALLTLQNQSQQRLCACGNFANPSLQGLCNACNTRKSSSASALAPPTFAQQGSLPPPPPPPVQIRLNSSSNVMHRKAGNVMRADAQEFVPSLALGTSSASTPLQQTSSMQVTLEENNKILSLDSTLLPCANSRLAQPVQTIAEQCDGTKSPHRSAARSRRTAWQLERRRNCSRKVRKKTRSTEDSASTSTDESNRSTSQSSSRGGRKRRKKARSRRRTHQRRQRSADDDSEFEYSSNPRQSRHARRHEIRSGSDSESESWLRFRRADAGTQQGAGSTNSPHNASEQRSLELPVLRRKARNALSYCVTSDSTTAVKDEVDDRLRGA